MRRIRVNGDGKMDTKNSASYIEMLVVYTDDKGIGKAKHLVPIARNDTHFVFINPKNSKMELVLRTNVVRMEELKKLPDFKFNPADYKTMGF